VTRPRPARLLAAAGLGSAAIIGGVLLLAAGGFAGIRWSHHGAATAAPLFLVAGAIAAIGVASGVTGWQAAMRLIAALAFTAWGLSQLFSGTAASDPLDDVAILLFVVDAGGSVIAEALSLLRSRGSAVQVPEDLLVPRRGCRCMFCGCAAAVQPSSREQLSNLPN
jgi:hypothetical protein